MGARADESRSFATIAHGPSGNAFDAQGRLYTCETRTRRVTRTDKKGKIEVLAEQWEGKRLNAPNDIVVSKNGHVYFTDPAFGDQADHRELDFYGVYHIPPKGPMKLVAKPDRPAERHRAFAQRAHPLRGQFRRAQRARLRCGPQRRRLERARADLRDRRACRTASASTRRATSTSPRKGIAIYSPEGKLSDTIPMPEAPSNCAFGDRDLQTLYVTARTSLYRLRRMERVY